MALIQEIQITERFVMKFDFVYWFGHLSHFESLHINIKLCSLIKLNGRLSSHQRIFKEIIMRNCFICLMNY
jgi:hypothetical protein